MRKDLKVYSVLAVVAALSVGTSLASATTFGGEIYGAFNTHSMGDWNDAIDASNSGGSDFNNVENGLTGGINARLWANPNWMFMAGWEPIFLKTEDDANPGNELKFDANVFGATGAYFFPTAGPGKFGLGAGVDFISINGEGNSPGSPSIELKGSTVGFHFMGLGEWTVSPGFAITGGAGYRIAKVDEIEGDGVVLETSPGNPIETDYSGFMARVGLAFYLPSGSN